MCYQNKLHSTTITKSRLLKFSVNSLQLKVVVSGELSGAIFSHSPRYKLTIASTVMSKS